MTRLNDRLAAKWARVGARYMPFAAVASPELPLGRLLRLSLFQVTVGMATVLMIGTLNRVMIVELGVSAWLVAVMVSLPLLLAPLRTVIGHRSDHHRSVLGWRRVPYLWMGTMLQFGGLAIMPFALIILSGDTTGPLIVGDIAAALAFLLVGAGLHMTQTVGLALATDIATPENRPRVVSMLCGMLLLGMAVSGAIFGLLLENFSQIRLIQVIQAAAVLTVVLNAVALWQQEARDPSRTRDPTPAPKFREAWSNLRASGLNIRHLVAVGVGTMAFSMQDILLEPYGGQILKLSVSETTLLTGLLAVGGLCGFLLSARRLAFGADPYRLAAIGTLAGVPAFAMVIFADPLQSEVLFAGGSALIGFGAALFASGTLSATMALAAGDGTGLVLGAWGAAQSVAAGAAIAFGGILRDVITALSAQGLFGSALNNPALGYGVVYHFEILLLFVTLVAIGPLVRRTTPSLLQPSLRIGLADSPRSHLT